MSPKYRSTLWAGSFGHITFIMKKKKKKKKQRLWFSLHTTLILLIRHLDSERECGLFQVTQFYCDCKVCHQHCHSSSSELYMHAKSLQSCLTLCDPMDCSLPASSVHGILQARILEWVAISFSRGSQSRDPTQVSHIAGRFFTFKPPAAGIKLHTAWENYNGLPGGSLHASQFWFSSGPTPMTPLCF